MGFQVAADVDLGFMRWLCVSLPNDPTREVLLETVGAPRLDDATAAQGARVVDRRARSRDRCSSPPTTLWPPTKR